MNLPQGYWLIVNIGTVYLPRPGSQLKITITFQRIDFENDDLQKIEDKTFANSWNFFKLQSRFSSDILRHQINFTDIPMFDIGDIYSENKKVCKPSNYLRSLSATFNNIELDTENITLRNFDINTMLLYELKSYNTVHMPNIKYVCIPSIVIAKYFYLASAELTDFFLNPSLDFEHYVDPLSQLLIDKETGDHIFHIIKNSSNRLKDKYDYLFLIRCILNPVFRTNLLTWRNELLNKIPLEKEAEVTTKIPLFSNNPIELKASYLLLNDCESEIPVALICKIDSIQNEFNFSTVIEDNYVKKIPSKNAEVSNMAPAKIVHKITPGLDLSQDEGGKNNPVLLDPIDLEKTTRILPEFISLSKFEKTNSKREYLLKEYESISTDKYGDSDLTAAITFGDYSASSKEYQLLSSEFNEWCIQLNDLLMKGIKKNNLCLFGQNIALNDKTIRLNSNLSKISKQSRNVCLWEIFAEQQKANPFYLIEIEPIDKKIKPRGILFFTNKFGKIKIEDEKKVFKMIDLLIELCLYGDKQGEWEKSGDYFEYKHFLKAKRKNRIPNSLEAMAKDYLLRIGEDVLRELKLRGTYQQSLSTFD